MALEIAAPEDLLHEFLGTLQVVTLQHGVQHLALGDQPMAQIGRENRDIRAIIRAIIAVAAIGIAAAGCRKEGREARQTGLAGGDELTG